MKTIKKKKLSIGVSDFKKLIINNLYFVDKSLFIKDVVDDMEVLLYPRPRRFGKTLNLSMLKYFYDCSEDNSHLFNDLAISKEEDIMEKQGKYPVIYLTFKDVKNRSKEKTFVKIYRLISELYNDVAYLLDSAFITKNEIEYFENIQYGKAIASDYENSLKFLAKLLYNHHKVNPVILIDEYDTPIHAGYTHDYYDEIIEFMRDFLSSGLKDNTYLEKAVITGILRVSQESIFTGLNNIRVYSMLSPKSNDKFGFTNDEVEEMLHYYESSLDFETVKKHYNGYNFFGIDIYNPWSILSSVCDNMIGFYWLNTSSNTLIKTMCEEADDEVKHDLQILVTGGKIYKNITEDMVFPELKTDKNLIWSFFMLCGYLRYDNYHINNKDEEDEDDNDANAELSIPNKEIRHYFKKKIIPNWFVKKDLYMNLCDLLVNGDIILFQKEFKEFCINSFSYFDVGKKEAENFYHAFVLGMVSCLKNVYQIKSNRESGLGRYDIMLIPKDKTKRGIIFEFKNINEDLMYDSIAEAIESAKKQVNEKKYKQELIDCGVEDIVHLIAAFKGKDVETISL